MYPITKTDTPGNALAFSLNGECAGDSGRIFGAMARSGKRMADWETRGERTMTFAAIHRGSGLRIAAILSLWTVHAHAALGASTISEVVRTQTLEECLSTAMQQNHLRPASRFAVAAAEAQHRQTLAGYWPQINLKATGQQLDQAPNFLFPASSISLPAQSMNLPGGVAMVTVPAGVLGPSEVQLPVSFPGQTINTPAQQFPIPAQNVKLMDEQSLIGAASATWLLYDGGMRKGFREQASAGIDAARQECRRTDLEITDSVKRMYWGSVLSRQLHQLGKDTLARMEATLSLTETLYKEGTGAKVTKTDYLDNKITVETLRSIVALLEKNEFMSQAALANTMGLGWRESIQPADKEIPFEPYAADLEGLVDVAYQFNPDWGRLEAGIRAAEGSLKTARSGHYPKIALTGEIHRWWNDYNAGMATDRNKKGWTVGVGMEVPLFDGFLTRGKVDEAKARLESIREQKFLLQDAIGLQVKDIFLGLESARKSLNATREAMKSATENRDLNTRAYQSELVETEKVIRAQWVEALTTSQHFKTAYDHITLQSRLQLIVGTEILKKLK